MRINQDRKIDQITGKRERIAINKENVFAWYNAWVMDDVLYPNINKVLTLAALIIPSTTEMERTFS